MPLAPPKGLKQMQKSFIMIQVETLHARNAKNAKNTPSWFSGHTACTLCLHPPH